MIRGDLSKLRAIERSIRELPRVVGAKVATAVAGEITGLAKSTFRSSQNAYGDAWEPGADGERVTLVKSGALASGLSYAATGTRLRARLGARYTKYQVGKRAVLPTGRLPVAYVKAISSTSNDVIRAELGK